MGSTGGGIIWANGQKLHENYKIKIFGSKQEKGQANLYTVAVELTAETPVYM